MSGNPVRSSGVGPRGSKRRIGMIVGVGAIALAVVAAGAIALTRQGHSARPATATVAGSAPALTAGRGAPVAFVEQEAVNAQTNGVVLPPGRDWDTLAGEAVGRDAVTLAGRGKYVEFSVTQPANSIDVRYSIPDRPDGVAYEASLAVYVNGVKERELALTNRYSWYYGAYPFVNTPSAGNPHHFYDEVHELLGQELAVGARVRLQIDATDTAASYTIDLVDFENVARPRPQPAGSLSVSDFGADASGKQDSSTAFLAAVSAATAQGKPLWIPAGTFQVNKHIVVPSNLTMTGAGEWYSVLTGTGLGIYGNAAPNPSNNVTLSYFAIDGRVDERIDAAQLNGIGGALGGGSVISNLWIEHTKVGIWLDGPFDGLSIDHTRIDDTTADGINLHDGITHATVTANFIRNTGDDGIAAWSENDADTDDVITFNTVEVPVLANNIAVYGGADNEITDDVVADTQTQGGGVHLANRFNAVPISGTTTVARVTALRTGVLDPNWKYGVGALWFWSSDSPMTGAIRVTDVDLIDSSYEGIQFAGASVDNVEFDNVSIAGAGTFALQVEAHGSAGFKNVVATNIGGPAAMYNCLFTGDTSSAFVITNRGGNSGWDTTFCGAWPNPVRTYVYRPEHATDAFAVSTSPAAGVVTAGASMTTTVTTSVAAGAAQAATLTAADAPAGVSVGFDLPSLTIGGSRTMTVTAASTVAPGTYPITVTAAGRSGSRSTVYALTVGPAGVGQLVASPATLTFGNQSAGTPSAPQQIRLTNTGTATVTVSAVAISGDFAQQNTCATPVAAGKACVVTVTMNATGAGLRNGGVIVTSNVGAVPIALAGTATASDNVALNKTATASGTQEGYPASNAVDGNTGSYWESANNKFPQSITVDLGSVQQIGKLVLTLPPGSDWTTRTQTIAVLTSTDGTSFVAAIPAAGYTFDPTTKNIVTIAVPSVQARALRLTVSANDGWPAAQFSEVEVYP